MKNVSSVFVSCHFIDRDFVDRLVEDLSTRLSEIKILYYMNISSGASLAESLLQEIERADVVLAVLSPDYVTSPWVAEELKVALNRNQNDSTTFIPLLYHPCTPSESVSRFDWIDFTGDYDLALTNLIFRITGVWPKAAKRGKRSGVARSEGLPMTPSQLKKRQALLDHNDQTLERWPQRTGPDYSREMRAVVDGLEAFARKEDARGSDRLERARTWRYAAHAWLDLGADGNIHCLEQAKADLNKAEVLLDGIADPVEWMKLHAGYAHVLRHLARVRVDSTLIRESRHRLTSALKLARTVQPEAVQALQAALANIDSVLPLAEEAEDLNRRIDALNTDTHATHQEPRLPIGASDAKLGFGIVKEQFDKEKGSMDSIDRDGLEDFMVRLGKHIEDYSAVRTKDESEASRGKLEALVNEFYARAKRPSLKGPGYSPGSRGENLLNWLQELKMFVLTVMVDAGASMGMRGAAGELFPRIASLTARLSEVADDEQKIRKLEMNEARGLANEVRLFARKQHIMLARPVWTHSNLSIDANRVFFSGSAQMHKSLEAAALSLGLEVNHPAPAGADFAERRWQQLRTANLAVFDLTGGVPQVYYELGIALTLGSELLLIARENTQVPFDVTQNIHFYSPSTELQGFLEDELHTALYGLQVRGGRGSTLAATLAYATRLAAADKGNALLQVELQSLRNAGRDPVKFLDALTSFNRFLRPYEHEILFPGRPGAYPEAPRCFAIMPFRAELRKIYSVVASVAKQAGVEPVRGDIAEKQQILESIWEEICRATHVTVDLTGLNLNVCLELGIAHTLGRPTLLIGQEGTERILHDALPGISKWRCHTYPEDPASKPAFIAILTKFLEI